MKINIAILASGSGSTAEAFITAVARGEVNATVRLVITNNATAGVLERVARLNQELGLTIETAVINGTTHPAAPGEAVSRGCQTAAEQQALIDLLKATNIDLVLLLGYMKKVGPRLVHEYGWRPEYTQATQARMLNTHPGLLPATVGYIGVHVQEYVLAKHLPEAGQTLHVVSEAYDDGPIIATNKVAIEPSDTAESLFERVQLAEKAHLPSDVERFIAAMH